MSASRTPVRRTGDHVILDAMVLEAVQTAGEGISVMNAVQRVGLTANPANAAKVIRSLKRLEKLGLVELMKLVSHTANRAKFSFGSHKVADYFASAKGAP